MDFTFMLFHKSCDCLIAHVLCGDKGNEPHHTCTYGPTAVLYMASITTNMLLV